MIMAVWLAWVYISSNCFRLLGGQAYALSLTGPTWPRAHRRSRKRRGYESIPSYCLLAGLGMLVSFYHYCRTLVN